MATKKTTSAAKKTAVQSPVSGVSLADWTDENTGTLGLVEAAESGYRLYGKYVLESRAIPSALDGLKPVARRILWSMVGLNLDEGSRKAKSARISGDCFVAGTKVITPTGEVSLESLKVGDLVRTRHGVQEVTKTFDLGVRPTVTVTLTNGKKTQCTLDQLFWCEDEKWRQRWVAAKDLTLEHVVAVESRDFVQVKSVVLSGQHPVYDIEVAEDHEFYADGMLAHNCMGKYHPHGDSAIYGAMQTMAGMLDEKTNSYLVTHCNQPLITGLGNWGDHIDGAAASRYTEARLSDYARAVLLDREYLTIIPMMPNYDDTGTEPIVLPAKLPHLMVNGTEGIGVGAKTEFPGFELDGVIQCSLLALHNELTPKLCYDNLVAKFPYGGGTLDTDSFKALLKNGNAGTLYAYPNSDYTGKQLVVTSVLPCLSFGSIRKILLKDQRTRLVKDETNKDGIRITALPHPMTQGERDAWAYDLQNALYGHMSARVNVLDFATDGATAIEFIQTNIPDIFSTWAAWRYDLERSVLAQRRDQTQAARHRDQLLLLVCQNRSVIPKALERDDSVGYLCQALKIEKDDGDWLMQQVLKRFSKLSADELLHKIDVATKRLAQLERDYSHPTPLIESEITNIRF